MFGLKGPKQIKVYIPPIENYEFKNHVPTSVIG